MPALLAPLYIGTGHFFYSHVSIYVYIYIYMYERKGRTGRSWLLLSSLWQLNEASLSVSFPGKEGERVWLDIRPLAATRFSWVEKSSLILVVVHYDTSNMKFAYRKREQKLKTSLESCPVNDKWCVHIRTPSLHKKSSEHVAPSKRDRFGWIVYTLPLDLTITIISFTELIDSTGRGRSSWKWQQENLRSNGHVMGAHWKETYCPLGVRFAQRIHQVNPLPATVTQRTNHFFVHTLQIYEWSRLEPQRRWSSWYVIHAEYIYYGS